MNEKVLKIVSSYVTDIPEDQIRPESNLITDLGINSIDLVSMVMDFEEAFSVTVPDDKLAGIKTVGDICALIK